jgi:C-terminal processing protease CtpA/Prc
MNVDFKQLDSGSGFPFSLSFCAGGRVCFLRARTFGDQFNSPTVSRQWYDILDQFFHQEASRHGTQTLILDMRGNLGGDPDLGVNLVWDVAKKPLRLVKIEYRYSLTARHNFLMVGLSRKNIPSWLMLDYLLLPTPILQSYSALPDPAGYRHLHDDFYEFGPVTAPPPAHPWPGRLVVLVDRRSYSACAVIATVVKDNGAGVVAGEETGGNPNTFGAADLLYPHYSGLLCQISTLRMVRPSGADDDGCVRPDLPLDTGATDEVLAEKIEAYLRGTQAAATSAE